MFAKTLSGLACIFLLTINATGQQLDPDPNRIFVTPLKWEKIRGAPRSEKVRVAEGTLAIFYLEGIYTEISASFIRTGRDQPVSLNLNEGFIVRLGSWSRTDDDQLIRTESREVLRDKLLRMELCNTVGEKQSCEPLPEKLQPGPVSYRTCRLEHPSSIHIAEAIVCTGGLNVFHSQNQIRLSDFPEIVRQLVRGGAKLARRGKD